LAKQAFESVPATGYGDRYYPVVVRVLEDQVGVKIEERIGTQ